MKVNSLRLLIREELRKILTEAKVDVSTTEFEFSHGQKPKGSGNWAFRLGKSSRDRDGDMFWPSSGGKGAMPYAKALKLATAEAIDTGMSSIVVMP